jgi:hypothetical protein
MPDAPHLLAVPLATVGVDGPKVAPGKVAPGRVDPAKVVREVRARAAQVKGDIVRVVLPKVVRAKAAVVRRVRGRQGQGPAVDGRFGEMVRLGTFVAVDQERERRVVPPVVRRGQLVPKVEVAPRVAGSDPGPEPLGDPSGEAMSEAARLARGNVVAAPTALEDLVEPVEAFAQDAG